MMETIRAIVIDDELSSLQNLQQKLEIFCAEVQVVATAQKPEEALLLIQHHKPDVIFLDIEMPKLNGIAFVQSLSNPPMIVFTTAYPNHALKGFELDVLDYLVKPISFERFLKTTNKAVERKLFTSQKTEEQKDNYIFIKSDSKFHKIKHSDIIYIEGLKDYVKIHTEDGSKLVLVNLKNIESKLPQNVFIRAHKSFIVSIEKITSVEGNVIHIGEKKIPIGKEYKEILFEKLIRNTADLFVILRGK